MKLKTFRYNKVKSTNDIAIKKINSGYTNGVVLTNMQSRGRGRHGRIWISKNGNLFVSIFFEIKKNINIKKLTIKNCELIESIITKIIKKKISIKKPNDILVNKAKICGILQEIVEKNNKKYIIIGIGINIIESPYLKGYKTTL